jgi:hypothetical protein
MTTLCKKLDLCANDAPTCLRPKCLTLVVVMKLATYVLQISSPSLFVPYYWIKRDGMMCLHRNVSSSSMVKLTLGNFFFLCHNTTDIRIKLIIKGTWKNGVIININCGIYINAKVVPVRDVISPAAGSPDRDRISGSARSESRPDRGRLPFVAVDPPSRSAI